MLRLPDLLLMAGALLISAIAPAAGVPSAPDRVILQLPWKHQFEFAGFYAAIEKGFYRERGLEVEIREYENGLDLIGEVTSGRATYGLSNSMVISERLAGKPLVLMANYLKRSALVIVGQQDVRTLQDLRGKQLMISTKDLESPLIRLAFRSAGLVPGRNLTIVPHSFDPGAFVNGEVDASAAFLSNELFHYERAEHPFQIIDIADQLPGLGDVYLFTSEAEARQRTERARAFLEASNEGWRYALEHPEEIVDLILAKYSTQKSREALLYEAEKTRQLMLPVAFPVGSLSEGRIEQVANALVELGEAPDKRRLRGFFLEPDHLANADSVQAALTPDERAWLAAHPNLTIGFPSNQPPGAIVGENGRRSGIFIDYLDLLNRRLGTHIHAELGQWADIVDAGIERQLDMIGVNFPLPVFARDFDFTAPLMKTFYYLYARSDDLSPAEDLETLSGKRVGYIEGTRIVSEMLGSRVDVELVPVPDNQGLIAALLARRVDVVLANLSLEYWRKQNSQAGVRVAALVPEIGGDLVISVRKDWPELTAILNKALGTISEEERQAILNRWFGEGLQTGTENEDTEIQMTAEEQDWLQQNGEICYAVDPDWMPFESIQDGRHVGMAADYMRLMRSRIPASFSLAVTKTWDESLTLARKRECDMVPFLNQSDERDKYLVFTTPYLRTPQIIVTRTDIPYVDGFEGLNGRVLAVTKGYRTEDVVKAHYPGIQLFNVSNQVEGLQAVSEGRAFALIGSLTILSNNIRSRGFSNLKISGTTDNYDEFRVGVRSDAPVLSGIFQKAVDSITTAEANEIFQKWTAIEYTQRADYSLLWKTLGAVALLFLAIVIWSMTLKRQVSERTSELREANHKLRDLASEITLVEERERQRLATELHDSPMQKLALAQMHLAASSRLPDPRSEQRFDTGLELMRETARELRTLQFELSPPLLYQEGLSAALEWLASHARHRFGVALRFRQIGTIPDLHGDSAIVLFQCARELVHNLAKHARASKGQIELSVKDGVLWLIVGDNGKGIRQNNEGEQKGHEKGFGLFSIRERLAFLGGALFVESDTTGTRASIRLPLPPDLPGGPAHNVG
ncbi:MAG: transporter substrate-binding domain-containing protein [Pseudomonadota bacterium]|nr:transporter substrate-binding domain-containing protein [Pseudomonadota bacterium]